MDTSPDSKRIRQNVKPMRVADHARFSEDSYLNGDLGSFQENASSIQENIVERLMILAASIALDSQDKPLLKRLISLLNDLIDVLEVAKSSPCSAPFSDRTAGNLREIASILTVRQREVLRLRATGLSVREIAEQLSLASHTVQSHIRDAIDRLGVSGGAIAAVAEARRRGLI